MYRSLCHPEGIARVRADAEGALCAVFAQAHDAIRDTFHQEYSGQGWDVHCEEGGYLVKRRGDGSTWSCVHGGTTVTVAVLLGGRQIVVANVGDSDATLCGTGTGGSERLSKTVMLLREHSPESAPLPPPTWICQAKSSVQGNAEQVNVEMLFVFLIVLHLK